MSRADRRRPAGRHAAPSAVLVLCLGLIIPGHGAAEHDLSELRIVTPAGVELVYSVEVADTHAERTRGLMYRDTLPADHGMLLLYESPRKVAIWMKNTPLPLDILFVGGDGTITHIVAEAVPFSESTMPSRGPARAVLEINGGQAAARGIVEGSRILYPPVWTQ